MSSNHLCTLVRGVALCLPMLAAASARADDAKTAAYYESWIGVKAPEFGPAAIYRPMGPPVRLSDYEGKRVLLFSFDAGDFVNGGPPEAEIRARLEALNAVRKEAGKDKFGVIGFTAGVVFTFPEEMLPKDENVRSLRALADYPVINTAGGGIRIFNEPYNVLRRPGGIVIDRRGVIRAIYRGAMTTDQIRAASTIDDWEGDPRPAPKVDPWEGKEPPRPEFSTVEVWRRPAANLIGLGPGDFDLDGVMDVLAVFTDGRLMVLAADGSKTPNKKLDTGILRSRVSVDWTEITPSVSATIVFDGGWPAEVPTFGQDGKMLWAYRCGAVDSAAWVDVDGDGTREMVVGTNGNDGLRLVSNKGETIWNRRDYRNHWCVAGFDATNSQPGLILSSDATGAIRAYDAAGSEKSAITLDDAFLTTFAVSPSGSAERQVAVIRLNRLGTVDHLVAFDLNGKIQWEYPLSGIEYPHTPNPIVVSPAAPNGSFYWLIQSSPSNVVAITPEGRLAAEFPAPAEGEPSLYTAVLRKDGSAVVVIHAANELVAYTIQEN